MSLNLNFLGDRWRPPPRCVGHEMLGECEAKYRTEKWSFVNTWWSDVTMATPTAAFLGEYHVHSICFDRPATLRVMTANITNMNTHTRIDHRILTVFKSIVKRYQRLQQV